MFNRFVYGFSGARPQNRSHAGRQRFGACGTFLKFMTSWNGATSDYFSVDRNLQR